MVTNNIQTICWGAYLGYLFCKWSLLKCETSFSSLALLLITFAKWICLLMLFLDLQITNSRFLDFNIKKEPIVIFSKAQQYPKVKKHFKFWFLFNNVFCTFIWIILFFKIHDTVAWRPDPPQTWIGCFFGPGCVCSAIWTRSASRIEGWCYLSLLY